jgi:hypothetical protein
MSALQSRVFTLDQVKDEAVKAFGQDEQHLSRAAVEQMDYTVSALKVRYARVQTHAVAAVWRMTPATAH